MKIIPISKIPIPSLPNDKYKLLKTLYIPKKIKSVYGDIEEEFIIKNVYDEVDPKDYDIPTEEFHAYFKPLNHEFKDYTYTNFYKKNEKLLLNILDALVYYDKNCNMEKLRSSIWAKLNNHNCLKFENETILEICTKAIYSVIPSLYDENLIFKNTKKIMSEYSGNHIAFLKDGNLVSVSIRSCINDTLKIILQFDIDYDIFEKLFVYILKRKKQYLNWIKANSKYIDSIPEIIKRKKIKKFSNTNLIITELLDTEIELLESISNIEKTIKKNNRHEKFIEIFKLIADSYNKFSVDDSYSKSGPDSSKFTSVHKGDIQFRTDLRFGQSNYSIGQYCMYALCIGSGFKYGNAHRLIEIVIVILLKKYPIKYSDGSLLRYESGSGSAYSTVGIG